MTPLDKPYVQLPIDAVDTVLHDPKGEYDADHFDRYETFESARDAALTSIEVMLDEADYDDEEHRAELERMQTLLESAASFAELKREGGYRKLLKKLTPAPTAAA